MLTDRQIDRLIQPLIDRQTKITVNIIKIIAQRIKEIGELTPSDVYKLQRLFKSGADVRKINKMLSELAEVQEAAVKDIIKAVALDVYQDAKPYYDYSQVSFIPFEENVDLQRVVRSVSKVTEETFKNLSNSTAVGFMIRDYKSPNLLRFQSIGDTYTTVVDEAVQAVKSGVQDYNSAMRRTTKQLVESGVRRIVYEPKQGKVRTERIESAVRRNILDGVRDISQNVQYEVGKQFHSNGKEISVHIDSAPDHEPVQGHQFTDEEYDKLQNDAPCQDVNGRKFPAMKRRIGIWNCRHFAWSIIIGVTKPNYTQEQLEKIIKDNHNFYTLPNGHKMSRYECSQHQRKLERQIRTAKEGVIIGKESGDMKLATQYQLETNKRMQEYQDFSNDCKLSPKWDRIKVEGYTALKPKEYAY